MTTALQPREREVLVMLGDGHTNAEIATRLGVSVKTVETYRARLRDKLGCVTRADLTRAARKL